MSIPEDQKPAAENRPGAEITPEKGSPIRVLLVDDHEDTNRSLALLLGRRGYQVKAATTLLAAEELAQGDRFDVLICDMSLPDGNGLELLARLREKAPVYGGIVLSGYNDEEDLERSQAAGYKAHLAKPVEVKMLDETIRRLMAEPAPSV